MDTSAPKLTFPNSGRRCSPLCTTTACCRRGQRKPGTALGPYFRAVHGFPKCHPGKMQPNRFFPQPLFCSLLMSVINRSVPSRWVQSSEGSCALHSMAELMNLLPGGTGKPWRTTRPNELRREVQGVLQLPPCSFVALCWEGNTSFACTKEALKQPKDGIYMESFSHHAVERELIFKASPLAHLKPAVASS